MTARVCQDNPDSMPSCLLYKFFDKYAESDWREPVQLNLKQRAQGLQASYLNALD